MSHLTPNSGKLFITHLLMLFLLVSCFGSSDDGVSVSSSNASSDQRPNTNDPNNNGDSSDDKVVENEELRKIQDEVEQQEAVVELRNVIEGISSDLGLEEALTLVAERFERVQARLSERSSEILEQRKQLIAEYQKFEAQVLKCAEYNDAGVPAELTNGICATQGEIAKASSGSVSSIDSGVDNALAYDAESDLAARQSEVEDGVSESLDAVEERRARIEERRNAAEDYVEGVANDVADVVEEESDISCNDIEDEAARNDCLYAQSRASGVTDGVASAAGSLSDQVSDVNEELVSYIEESGVLEEMAAAIEEANPENALSELAGVNLIVEQVLAELDSPDPVNEIDDLLATDDPAVEIAKLIGGVEGAAGEAGGAASALEDGGGEIEDILDDVTEGLGDLL